MVIDREIETLLDEEGRLKVWPRKQARKLAALRHLAGLFEPNRVYTEREVNALLEGAHKFGDLFLLRRALVEAGLLARDPHGREYRRKERS